MDSYNITWIGTGSGLNPVLGNTSFSVSSPDYAGKLLVDCGSTVPLKLIENKEIADVTDVIITHTHADHIGGLEGLGFMNYFALKRRGDDRPNLYVATNDMAHNLWEHSLKGGMQKIQEEDGTPVDATLDTYFRVHVGKNVSVNGLPQVNMFETHHVHGLENYGLVLEGGVFYSGDTTELPPHNPKIIFQDCQFFTGPHNGAGDVHISYDRLIQDVPDAVRAKMHLVHLGGGSDQKDPKVDGFAGFVTPGDTFQIN